MSDFEERYNYPLEVIKPTLPYVVPADRYAILFIDDNPNLSNYPHVIPYDEGVTIPSLGFSSEYIVKVYEKP